jgi:hypothetical protein
MFVRSAPGRVQRIVDGRKQQHLAQLRFNDGDGRSSDGMGGRELEWEPLEELRSKIAQVCTSAQCARIFNVRTSFFTSAVGDNSAGSNNSGIKSIQTQEGPGRRLAEEGADEDLEKSPSLLSPCLSSLVLALTLTLRRLSTPLTYDLLTTHARMQDRQRVPDTDTERAQNEAKIRTPTNSYRMHARVPAWCTSTGFCMLQV